MPQYCLVKHHIVSSVIDGSDPGNEPDVLPVSGDVTFYPILDRGDSVVVTVEGEKVSYVISPISARIVKGKISVNGEEGVKLFAGGPDTNPERVRYRAVFKGLHSGITQIALKDVLFEAVPNGELELSIAQSVPGKPYSGFSKSFEASLEETVAALGQVREAASTAVAAEESASEHAQTATTKADEASQSATSASASAQIATTKAEEASSSATTASSASDTAVAARSAAEQAATNTASALDGRIPADLALRVDTTVGTRIFAGDTMIYGDTGWRDVSGSLMNGWTGTVWFRRKGDLIVYRFSAVRGDSATANQLLPGFPGSAVIASGTVSIPYLAKVIDLNVSWSVNGATISSAHRGLLSGELSFHTQSAWPTSLPGTPA